MNIYKRASRLGNALTFKTEKGVATIKNLWDLNLKSLDKLAVRLDEEYKNSNTKSFIGTNESSDDTLKLKFDIVLDILETRVKENKEALNRAEIKKNNEKVMAKIKEIEDNEMNDMSKEELLKSLK